MHSLGAQGRDMEGLRCTGDMGAQPWSTGHMGGSAGSSQFWHSGDMEGLWCTEDKGAQPRSAGYMK